MDESQIKAARALCADPPEQDDIDPPICPACGDEYILDNDNGTYGHMMCDPCGTAAFEVARPFLRAALEALESARRDLAIAHQDASQLSGDANRVLRELKERVFAKIERHERDAEALTDDLAATKAALAEAVKAFADTLAALSYRVDGYNAEFEQATERLAALKAKVRP